MVLKNSVAEEIMQRFEQRENLPEMAFKVVFEHLDYFQKTRKEIAVLQKLMNAEKENKLPKLEEFRLNAEILANHYIDAMDVYVDDVYDVKNWLTEDLLDKNITFLSDFCIFKNLDSNEEKEILHEMISNWRNIAGNKIADYILMKKETENLTQENINDLADIALKYNPDCVDALKLKVDYLNMMIVK